MLPVTKSLEHIFELSDLNLSIEKGTLIFIIGKVASGKSSILYSLMGEMKPFNPFDKEDPRYETQYPPRLSRNGSVSFLSEKPWLMPTTIKENILVGKPLDEQRLSTCIKMAQFEYDLKLMSEGIETVIGENGTTLSGG